MAKVMPLPYVPIDPMIDESERMDLFLDALGDHDDADPEYRIHRLLLWAGRVRIDGHTGAVSARTVAKVCRWVGKPQQLIDALLTAGWLVTEGDGYYIEGWSRHGGRVLAEREKFTEKKRSQRCAAKGHPKDSCTCPGVVPKDVPGDIPKTSPVRPDDVPPVKCEVRSVKGVLEEEAEKEERRLAPTDGSLFGTATPAPREKAPTKRQTEVDAVIAHYMKTWPRTETARGLGLHLSPDRPGRRSHPDYKIISARLDEGTTADDLCLAIDGNKIDDHHATRGMHSIIQVFRNAAKVEQFIGTVTGLKQMTMGPKTKHNIAVLSEWLDEVKDAEQ